MEWTRQALETLNAMIRDRKFTHQQIGDELGKTKWAIAQKIRTIKTDRDKMEDAGITEVNLRIAIVTHKGCLVEIGKQFQRKPYQILRFIRILPEIHLFLEATQVQFMGEKRKIVGKVVNLNAQKKYNKTVRMNPRETFTSKTSPIDSAIAILKSKGKIVERSPDYGFFLDGQRATPLKIIQAAGIEQNNYY